MSRASDLRSALRVLDAKMAIDRSPLEGGPVVPGEDRDIDSALGAFVYHQVLDVVNFANWSRDGLAALFEALFEHGGESDRANLMAALRREAKWVAKYRRELRAEMEALGLPADATREEVLARLEARRVARLQARLVSVSGPATSPRTIAAKTLRRSTSNRTTGGAA